MNNAIDKRVKANCVRIKELGYSSSRHIHMYGERFEIVSDPFPEAILVTTAKEQARRTLSDRRTVCWRTLPSMNATVKVVDLADSGNCPTCGAGPGEKYKLTTLDNFAISHISGAD